jgi:hypothetical protein
LSVSMQHHPYRCCLLAITLGKVSPLKREAGVMFHRRKMKKPSGGEGFLKSSSLRCLAFET